MFVIKCKHIKMIILHWEGGGGGKKTTCFLYIYSFRCVWVWVVIVWRHWQIYICEMFNPFQTERQLIKRKQFSQVRIITIQWFCTVFMGWGEREGGGGCCWYTDYMIQGKYQVIWVRLSPSLIGGWYWGKGGEGEFANYSKACNKDDMAFENDRRTNTE